MTGHAQTQARADVLVTGWQDLGDRIRGYVAVASGEGMTIPGSDWDRLVALTLRRGEIEAVLRRRGWVPVEAPGAGR